MVAFFVVKTYIHNIDVLYIIGIPNPLPFIAFKSHWSWGVLHFVTSKIF